MRYKIMQNLLNASTSVMDSASAKGIHGKYPAHIARTRETVSRHPQHSHSCARERGYTLNTQNS